MTMAIAKVDQSNRKTYNVYPHLFRLIYFSAELKNEAQKKVQLYSPPTKSPAKNNLNCEMHFLKELVLYMRVQSVWLP